MEKFSESGARDIRYNFFENVIDTHFYNNLITAHQLNDKMEWFLMQFAKGAGLLELTGMSEFENREKYRLLRPIIDISKNTLLNYLTKKEIKYFIDASNFDEKYRRNYFRHNFSNRFLDEFESGIHNSFRYLEEDKALILKGGINIEREQELFYFKIMGNDRVNIFYIDKILKRVGYVLSSKQRDGILKDREVVVGGEWAIAIMKSEIYISPYRYTTMPKIFKERCRLLKIPKLIRPYLFEIKSRICN
jgi:tRNA(Ile)-lysidine synthase